MKSEELVEKVRNAILEDWSVNDVAAEQIILALKHLSDFCKSDCWSRDEVCDTCFEIGELLYTYDEMDALQDVYYLVRSEMGGVAARYLEHFWNGVGSGAWRG